MCQHHATLVTLHLAQTHLTVTDNHRVICPSGERIARDFKVGDVVLCGSRVRKVTKITQQVKTTDLVEIRFNPDEPVETFMVPHFGVLTKGQPMPVTVERLGALGPMAVNAIPSSRAHRRSRSAGP